MCDVRNSPVKGLAKAYHECTCGWPRSSPPSATCSCSQSLCAAIQHQVIHVGLPKNTICVCPSHLSVSIVCVYSSFTPSHSFLDTCFFTMSTIATSLLKSEWQLLHTMERGNGEHISSPQKLQCCNWKDCSGCCCCWSPRQRSLLIYLFHNWSYAMSHYFRENEGLWVLGGHLETAYHPYSCTLLWNLQLSLLPISWHFYTCPWVHPGCPMWTWKFQKDHLFDEEICDILVMNLNSVFDTTCTLIIIHVTEPSLAEVEASSYPTNLQHRPPEWI